MPHVVATFTAVPVGQGDAFLLERADGKTILVDGGRARTVFAAQLMLVRPTPAIDVAVCTHADADHAEGLVGLLEASLAVVRDVWLPGRWTERLVDLIVRPADFLDELLTDVRAEQEAGSLESPDAREGSERGEDVDVDLDGVEAALGLEDPLAPDILDGLADGVWLPSTDLVGSARGALWIEAVQAAARIRKVARAAHHHGARIRWFDFEEARRRGTPAGGEAFLHPINSVELTAHMLRRKVSALRFLRLSVANRESLVFVAPEDPNNSAVIFSADSDLASLRSVPATRTPLVTAPHHGAETNAAAYGVIAASLPSGLDPQWVRSDGNYRKRPGATYLSGANRVCTLCRAASRPKQPVHLVDGPGGWQLARGVQVCTCK